MGVTGGVFFAFSDFVMRALRRLPHAEALAAMQQINRAAPSPLFMAALFGTAIDCAVLGAAALVKHDEPGAPHQLVGSVLYLATVAVTVGYHVPKNDRLAAVDPASATAGSRWLLYASSWTRWNHVRSIGTIAATTSFILALNRRR